MASGKSAMTLAERVLRTVRQHALVPSGGRVAVALSGGADSVALVHILRDLEAAGELTVAGLAHFNHQLRGAEADEDESFCRSMAVELRLPFEVGRGDVRQRARDERRSLEDAARVLRYAFLTETVERLGADVVAVAHSRDDQAETFLLRLLRGSGPRGLAGILPRAGCIIRPLLEIPRTDLRLYAAGRHLAFREDSSNADLAFARNRVRHELLPYLEREFSPGIAAVLAREAAIAREDEDRLHQEAIVLAGTIVLTDTKPADSGDGGPNADHVDPVRRLEIDSAALRSLHPALGARVARIVLSVLASRRFIGSDHVECFLRFAREARPGAALSLPGQQAVCRPNRIVLGPEPPRGASVQENSFRFPLSIPGEVTVPRRKQDAWAISAEPIAPDAWSRASWPVRGAAVAIAAERLSLPLAIRQRKAGDRFRPMGLGGRGRKLQDFLVDRKIPKEMRDLLPLVVDGDDRIVWVVGESASEEFRVTDPAQGVILLKVRRLGGPG